MNDQTSDEVEALNRVMYLLEEGSFAHLSEQNAKFAAMIDELYETATMQQQILLSQYGDSLAIW